MAFHLDVAGDVFNGVLFCVVLFHEMSWMRSGTELSQFLKIFQLTQLIRFCYFYFFGVVLSSKGPNCSELIA